MCVKPQFLHTDISTSSERIGYVLYLSSGVVARSGKPAVGDDRTRNHVYGRPMTVWRVFTGLHRT